MYMYKYICISKKIDASGETLIHLFMTPKAQQYLDAC